MSQTSAAPSGVTLEVVRHVAELANLQPQEADLPRLVQDLNAILGHIEHLSVPDTADVPPMAQVGSATSAAQHGESLRADIEVPCDIRPLVMREAPESDGRFFKVPKVLER